MTTNLTGRVSILAPARNLLTFNSIKQTPGKYVNVNTGNILIVFSPKAHFVGVPEEVCRTGYTRTGMIMFEQDTGKFRHVQCGQGPDNNAVWEKYTGTITL